MPCLMESKTRSNHHHLTASAEPYTSEDTVIQSGLVEIVSYKGNPKVFVVIHQTSTEHFAVFYPVRLIASARKPLSTINLRSSLITSPEPGLITIRPRKDIDGSSLTLRIVNPVGATVTTTTTTNENNFDKWISAFSDHGLNIINNINNNNNQHKNINNQSGYNGRYMPGTGNCNPVRFTNLHLPALIESVED